MKIIKNAIFYLFLGIVILFTIMSFCAEGSLWVLISLWILTALLWVAFIISFKNQIKDYLLYCEAEENPKEVVVSKPRERMSGQSTPDDFEKCYHIALLYKIREILSENKSE